MIGPLHRLSITPLPVKSGVMGGEEKRERGERDERGMRERERREGW